jgi:hypothetical protein
MKNRHPQVLRVFLLSLFIVSQLSSSVSLGTLCADLFSNKDNLSYVANPGEVQAELVRATAESEKAMAALRQRSSTLKAKIDKAAKDGKIETFEFGCIGGGPACIAAMLKLTPEQRTRAVIIERTNWIAGVFAEKDFVINTEVKTTSIPNSIVPFKNFSNLKYPLSRQLAAYLQTNLSRSKVHVLLATEVTRLKYDKAANETRVDFKSGHSIKVRQLVLGTGLGEPTTKVPGHKYLDLYKHYQAEWRKDKTKLWPILHSDNFLVWKREIERTVPSSEISNRLPKRILILGSGDGSRIAMEALFNLGLSADTKIFILGVKIESAADFIESQGKFDRYLPAITKLIQEGKLVGVQAHCVDTLV